MYVYFVYADKLKGTKLVFLAPAEGFWMNMKISLVAAFIIALPVIFQQLWSFISPGLHSKEKKYVMPFVFIATVAFSYRSRFLLFHRPSLCSGLFT